MNAQEKAIQRTIWREQAAEEILSTAAKMAVDLNLETLRKKQDAEDTLIKELVNVLMEIRKNAMDHPVFDELAFKNHDIEELCREGGDVCDWTMVAMLADDALKTVDKTVLLK